MKSTPIPVDAVDLAALGEGRVAYVMPMQSEGVSRLFRQGAGRGGGQNAKPMQPEDVSRLFPQAPELAPGLALFALLSASGSPILLTDSRDTALANAWAHDLQTVSLN